MQLYPLNGMSVPDDIARLVALLASKDTGWVTGANKSWLMAIILLNKKRISWKMIKSILCSIFWVI